MTDLNLISSAANLAANKERVGEASSAAVTKRSMADRLMAGTRSRIAALGLALGLAVAGSGASKADASELGNIASISGARTESAANRVLLASNDRVRSGHDVRTSGRSVPNAAPLNGKESPMDVAARSIEALIKDAEARKDEETLKILREVRNQQGSLEQNFRDFAKGSPSVARRISETLIYDDVLFFHPEVKTPDDLLNPMDRAEGVPEFLIPVSGILPAGLYPVTKENLAQFLDHLSWRLRYNKPVVLARINRLDPSVINDEGKVDTAAIAAARNKTAGVSLGYFQKLSANPAALEAFLKSVNTTFGALSARGGDINVNIPWKLAAHLASASLVASGVPDALSFGSDLRNSALRADEFDFLVRFRPFLTQEVVSEPARLPTMQLQGVDQLSFKNLENLRNASPDAKWASWEDSYVGGRAMYARAEGVTDEQVRSSALYLQYSYQIIREDAPCILAESAKYGPEAHLNAAKAIRAINARVSETNVGLSELTADVTADYGLPFNSTLAAADAASKRGALTWAVKSIKSSVDTMGTYNNIYARLSDTEKILAEGKQALAEGKQALAVGALAMERAKNAERAEKAMDAVFSAMNAWRSAPSGSSAQLAEDLIAKIKIAREASAVLPEAVRAQGLDVLAKLEAEVLARKNG